MRCLQTDGINLREDEGPSTVRRLYAVPDMLLALAVGASACSRINQQHTCPKRCRFCCWLVQPCWLLQSQLPGSVRQVLTGSGVYGEIEHPSDLPVCCAAEEAVKDSHEAVRQASKAAGAVCGFILRLIMSLNFSILT